MSITYNANPNLKGRDVEVEYTPEQLREYIRCAKDPIYFITNYVKIINLDKGLIPFEPFPYQQKLIQTLADNRFVVAKCPRQCGKDLSLTTPIPTPNGWKILGDIVPGDIVFSEDGTKTTVTETKDFIGNECYEIEFDSGELIVAGADHDWKVERNGYWTNPKIVSTVDLIEIEQSRKGRPKSAPLRIKSTSPITSPNISLPIDPYTLGVWLGDGNSNDARFTMTEEDGVSVSSLIESNGHSVEMFGHNNESKARRFSVRGLHSLLNKNNLLGNKHIPSIYFNASTEQKQELLKGLMDTDGTCRTNQSKYGGSGSCEFFNKNKLIIDGVREILFSLGIKNRLRHKIVDGETYFTVSFATDLSMFNLPRKQDIQKKLKGHPKNGYHYIQGIRKVDSVPTRCLTVDHPSQMFLCGRSMIPTHNSTTLIAFLLHQIIFTPDLSVAVLANKQTTARELLGRLKLAYEHLPKWLQQGVIEWNKGSILLQNNSKVIASSTSGSAIRGLSINMLLLDEFAFLPNNIANEFFTSVYPTISSGTNTKIFIVSTPKGMNLFHSIWQDASLGRNEYIPFGVHWSDWPGHDDAWREKTISNMGADGEKKFQQEYECEFLGSSNTLISDWKLATLTHLNPISSRDGVDIYFSPEKDHTYIATVDISGGGGGDHHAIIVFDVTQFPYKMVAKWRSNTMSPLRVPDMIYLIANAYNEAFVLIESNNNGGDVARALHDDLEYENILMTTRRTGLGQVIGGGFGASVKMGVAMDRKVKSVGCSNLKALIESDKLLIPDHDTIQELRRFISVRSSYESESGYNDDLVMCLVSFAWLINQRYFKDLMDQDIQAVLRADQTRLIEEDILPFGFYDDGRPEPPPKERFVV